MDRRLRDGLPALTWNPFRDEGAAFQLVLISIGVGGVVVIGSWIANWLGIGVVVALFVAGCGLLWRRRRRASVVEPATRVLLVGEPTEALVAAVRTRAEVDVAVDVAAAEDVLRTFPADEIVVLDPAAVAVLRARFVVPVRVVSVEDYLPETASR